MCAVSAISDYYMRPTAIPNQVPNYVIRPDLTPDMLETLKEIVEKLDKIDKSLKDRDCQI